MRGKSLVLSKFIRGLNIGGGMKTVCQGDTVAASEQGAFASAGSKQTEI